jgi:hypothetical protein
VIIYSHGFGVLKDARGLFSSIDNCTSSPGLMFDYNIFDPKTKQLNVATLSEQRVKLEEVLRAQTQTVDLICHSQGCIVAALLPPDIQIRSAMLLAPPEDNAMQKLIDLFEARPSSVIDIEGISRLERRDGTVTIVQPEYWQSLSDVGDVMSRYSGFVSHVNTTIITANQDEVVGKTDFSSLEEYAEIIQIDGNHDFEGKSRDILCALIKQRIS